MAKAKAASGGDVSQMQMVRSTLEELGGNAKPQAIQDHIRTKYNKELPKTIISNYKSNLKKKGGGAATAVAAGGRARKAAGGGIHLEDLETVRGLVGRLGADQVRRLVEVLA